MTTDVDPRMLVEETYLGDGLYASFDGHQIKLRAPRAGVDHEVYLELPVYLELLRFALPIGWAQL